MMTDKQMRALINYIDDQGHVRVRKELVEAFGFEANYQGYPVTPTAGSGGGALAAICKSCGEQFHLHAGHTCTGIAAKPVCSNCGQIMGANHVCTAGPVTLEGHVAYKADGAPAYAGDIRVGEVLSTSDPEGHRQAITDADYEAKQEAVHALLRGNSTEQKRGVIGLANAVDIMRLWPELKAIMEPGNPCPLCLAAPGERHNDYCDEIGVVGD